MLSFLIICSSFDIDTSVLKRLDVVGALSVGLNVPSVEDGKEGMFGAVVSVVSGVVGKEIVGKEIVGKETAIVGDLQRDYSFCYFANKHKKILTCCSDFCSSLASKVCQRRALRQSDRSKRPDQRA